MEPKLQRRIQRQGWDLAAADYEPLWQEQLAAAHRHLLAAAALASGEQVLDVACGTGIVALEAARAVAPHGRVLGTDLSPRMIEAAAQRAQQAHLSNVAFARMDAEALDLPAASFDAVLCALGLMYMPQPERALLEMRRVLRPGGRIVVAVWGERSCCGWSALFPIVDDEVTSEVCPLFFRLGQHDVLARLCADAGFDAVQPHRITAALDYADAGQACAAAFVGGPVALAWSRFDDRVRARVCERYLQAIEPWRSGQGYRVPGEFVIVAAAAPRTAAHEAVVNADGAAPPNTLPPAAHNVPRAARR
jgi:ubiquinone/menaquinone biosynthesis C-methylase UbiE